MKPLRTTSRRSFLRRVGATASAGAALALVGGSEAGAQTMPYTGVTDCDTGNPQDRPGYGTGNRTQITDSDTGPYGDPRCHGQGSPTGSTGTPYNPGYQPDTRCSDSDYGPYGDPGGHGSHCRGRTNDLAPHVSGCSDNDPANGGDSIGNGRRCEPR